jgi:hypothetical protein
MKFLTEGEFYLCRLKHIDMIRNYKTTKQDTGHEGKKDHSEGFGVGGMIILTF